MKVLAAVMDLPFYLRLPSQGFMTWDPEFGVAAIQPRQNMGQVSFSKTCDLGAKDKLEPGHHIKPQSLLDSPGSPPEGMGYYQWMVTSILGNDNGPDVPTLRLSNGGGFSELRPYTEITVFTVVTDESTPISETAKSRTFEVLNHFIDVYRLITQDPHVFSLDKKMDLYLVDYSLCKIPQDLTQSDTEGILRQIDRIAFPQQIGPTREVDLHVCTLDDFFPGRILEENHLRELTALLRSRYEMPLHYELILTAQVELKQHNYHVAILEAETAFEVYVASTLPKVSVKNGRTEQDVLNEMEYPGPLHMLSQRIKGLDEQIAKYRINRGYSATSPFLQSGTCETWQTDLYKPRNRIIHAGWRSATFESAKKGIAACKAAVKELEDRVPGISDTIQIDHGVNHLQYSTGRLRF